mmetsp:Transcript_13351/g.28886  ORF Transcript_13351/g.28886 Transcript_13351/m.28886 type:complete len:818 (+) Transcript_13351:140-2593(+)
MLPRPRTRRTRRRLDRGRRSLLPIGLLLAASSATLAASSDEPRRAPSKARVTREISAEDLLSGRPNGPPATRLLKKTPQPTTDFPTLSPTDPPVKKHPKPKKTHPPTYFPTRSPAPTDYPTMSFAPTNKPTPKPTKTPKPVPLPDVVDTGGDPNDVLDTPNPVSSTAVPTANPTTVSPTASPTTLEPTVSPTKEPTRSPSNSPTNSPSYSPTMSPSTSFQPTAIPSAPPTTTQQPTISPTGAPSESPSHIPTYIPSASPTTSAMPSMAPIPYARSDRVDVRYTPWSDLPDQTRAIVEQLDYDEATWSSKGTNPVENTDWATLDRIHRDAARQLGYDQHSWDCWQNHFQSYRWIDLGLPYVQVKQWWEALGWDIYSWNQYDPAPPSDDLGWYELSNEERAAAAQLCYFREAWDGGEGEQLVDGFPIERPEFRYVHWWGLEKDTRDMADEGLKYSALTWNVMGLAGIEERGWADLTAYEREAAMRVGFNQTIWDCWQNHFRSYAWDDLAFYGLDLPYMAMGWTALSWEGVETPPPSQTMTWKELTQKERQVASELCYFRDNWDGLDITPNTGVFLYPKPKQRYVEWDDQPADARRVAAGSLSYNRNTWNELGTAEVEQRSWEELTEHQKSDAMSLGFYKKTWDCFHNHYRSYEWYELDRDSRDALQVLGWSENSWETGEEEPPSYDNKWERLSESEQTVAAILCFFEDNWDGNSLEVVSTLVITEDGAVVEEGFIIDVGGDGTGGSNAGGLSGSESNGGGSGEGGSTADAVNGKTPTPILGPDADIISVKPSGTANSAVTAGVKPMMCILSFALGVLAQ